MICCKLASLALADMSQLIGSDRNGTKLHQKYRETILFDTQQRLNDNRAKRKEVCLVIILKSQTI